MSFTVRSFCAPLLATLAACASESGAVAPASPSTRPETRARAGETSSFVAAGPQSFTPEVHPRGRERAVRQLWSSPIGRTDHRSSIFSSRGAVWVGAKQGKNGPAGVYVIDGKTGARRAVLPAAAGDVVGIALEGERVYSTGSSGEVVATSRAGAPVFRVNVGSPIMTPPTLVDYDGDGTLDVAVGDGRGRVIVLDGNTGVKRWMRALGSASDHHFAIGGGLAAADLDRDGKPEIVAGTQGGRLYALRAADGETMWQLSRASSLRAAPIVADVDADKQLEVIVGWADGDVAIFDGRKGKELWSALMEEDNGDSTGLLASPTPLPGGNLLVPTSRWGKEDSVVVLRAHDRGYRSKQGSVVASPVLGVIEPGTTQPEAVVGTMQGDVVSFDSTGGTSFLYHLDSAIEAPALIADIEGNGLQELVVATSDGQLVALAIHAATPPLAGVARGASLHNDGIFPPVDLGWRLP